MVSAGKTFRELLRRPSPSIPFLFLAMIAVHVGHVFEEVWGGFRVMELFLGLGWFLIVNWLLLLIPLTLFYFLLARKPVAYLLGAFYAGFMAVNGAGHNIALVITGRYFHGFAGSFTGIPMIVIGPLLARALFAEYRMIMPRGRRPEEQAIRNGKF